jgi:hypothetical protein
MGRPKGSKNKQGSETTADNSSVIETIINAEPNTLTRVPWPAKTEEADNPNSEGPQKYMRDQHGLLANANYIFNEDGSVNWRAMIKDENLFPNRSWFDSRKLDLPKSIDGLKDHQLLIKLGGIKELARLRGFTSVNYYVEKCEKDHVAVSCNINFIANYETGGRSVKFQDVANATLNNTSSFATKFLETIACNRAFVRCVRNFLNVHIVGDDEIDKSNSKNNFSGITTGAALTPDGMLHSAAKEKLNCSNFEEFKVILRDWWKSGKYQNESVRDWEDFSDIPATEARVLMKLIND